MVNDPGRDRALAHRPRLPGTPRRESLDHLVHSFMKSEEVAKMRRFARVRGALETALGPAAAKVTPVRLAAGVLTLEVKDGVLLAELRTMRSTQLLQILADQRTGVTRLMWRIARAET